MALQASEAWIWEHLSEVGVDPVREVHSFLALASLTAVQWTSASFAFSLHCWAVR